MTIEFIVVLKDPLEYDSNVYFPGEGSQCNVVLTKHSYELIYAHSCCPHIIHTYKPYKLKFNLIKNVAEKKTFKRNVYVDQLR